MGKVNYKISFINNCKIDIDLSTIEVSNPGIGGTEYLFLNIPYQLNKYFGHDITIYSKYEINIKNYHGIHLKTLTTIDNAYRDAVDNNCDVFVTREDMIPSKRIEGKTKLVLWLHLTHSYQETRHYAYLFDYIIFVSKYERDKYCFDKTIRKKSTYIYNIVPTFIGYDIIDKKENNNVCFIGSLNPGKGFSSLTKIWPKIIKKYPKAKLIVIGSGNLYNPNQALGPLGIAEKNYEKEIMQPLVQTNSQNTVIFLGKMSTNQMNNELKNVSVGIVNLPANIGETFCMTVFDYAKFRIPVIVRRIGGIKNTVIRKGSYCYKTTFGLKRLILKSIRNKNITNKKGEALYDYLKNNFQPEKLNKNWDDNINLFIHNHEYSVSLFAVSKSLFSYTISLLKNTIKKIIYLIIRVKNSVMKH